MTEPAAPLFRLWLVGVLVTAMSGLLIWRWVHLQVDRFAHFSELAHENQVKLLPVEPPRGIIHDRHGFPLAGNKNRYSLKVGSDFASQVLGKIDTLTTIIQVGDDALKKLRAAHKSRVYKGEIVLRERLSEDEISAFTSWQFLFPEVVLHSDLVRFYPHGDAAGHALGYVGRINDKDVDRLKKTDRHEDYLGAKFIGKTGVELLYEDRLRGQLGTQEAQVDAHGRIFSSRIIIPPTPGQDIHLTIDWTLQRLAESLLADERGAVVMMDIGSGELLVLASNPRYDGNLFIFGISHDDWNALNGSDERPLIHRAIYGQYAPGSTIKPFLALSALQNGWRETDYEYESRGYFQLTPKHRFHDWKRGGHGRVDFTRSIVRSVNTFYYQLGHDVGIDALHAALQRFGFGAPTGIDLDNEKAGILPSVKWKEKTYNQPWFPGDTISSSVGQGYLQATPLQMARAIAMIANGGRLLTPHLLLPKSKPERHRFTLEYLNIVRDALEQVTQPGGTAPAIGRSSPYAIAGKTGTAQVSRLRLDEKGNRIKNEDLPKRLRDHAWFVGYAPSASPSIAIAVIVENGGSGGRIAGPIVRQMLDAYMKTYRPDALPREDAADAQE